MAWPGASMRTQTLPCSSRCQHAPGGLHREVGRPSLAFMTPPTLQDFYQEVANPLLTAVTFEYPSNAVEEITQNNFRLLFKGSEMVVAGKLQAQGPDVLTATVSGKLVSVAKATLEGKGSLPLCIRRGWAPIPDLPRSSFPLCCLWMTQGHGKDSMRKWSDSHETTCAVPSTYRPSATGVCTCEHR